MESREYRSFRDLECWKACRELRIFVAKEVLPVLPKEEKFRLGDQLVRAARSTTANIAEGYGRFHYLDTSRFVSNARGSAYETLDHLVTANDEKILGDELLQIGEERAMRAIKLLNGYIRYLQDLARTTPSVREPPPEYSIPPVSSHSTILPFSHSTIPPPPPP